MSEMSVEEALDKYREANYQTAAEYRKEVVAAYTRDLAAARREAVERWGHVEHCACYHGNGLTLLDPRCLPALDKYREANYQTAAEYRKRDNFVEAMRVLVKLPGYLNAKRQAAEAFADAKCRLASRGDTHKTGLCYRKESDSIEPHTACRAALLKEIGL